MAQRRPMSGTCTHPRALVRPLVPLAPPHPRTLAHSHHAFTPLEQSHGHCPSMAGEHSPNRVGREPLSPACPPACPTRRAARHLASPPSYPARLSPLLSRRVRARLRPVRSAPSPLRRGRTQYQPLPFHLSLFSLASSRVRQHSEG